jgi:hypothetical protein
LRTDARNFRESWHGYSPDRWGSRRHAFEVLSIELELMPPKFDASRVCNTCQNRGVSRLFDTLLEAINEPDLPRDIG